MISRKFFRTLLAAGMFAASAVPAVAAPVANDETKDLFIKGYAFAVLEREFTLLTDVKLTVSNGEITITASGLDRETKSRLIAIFCLRKGVKKVNRTDCTEFRQPGAMDARKATAPADGALPVPTTKKEFFPKNDLFAPLIADPRWPHFSAGLQNYSGHKTLSSVGAVSFGETFSLYRRNAFQSVGGRWELGLQAAVFGIFDLDADSKDLINADYWVAPALSYRNKEGDFSLLARLLHQSSHLGDEQLTNRKIPLDKRINLSYEAAQVLFSFRKEEDIRVYAGAQFLLHKEPSDLEPWSIQYGVQWSSGPRPWLSKIFSPGASVVLGADFKNLEEADWDANVSLRGGLQFKDANFPSMKFQIMFEYFTGKSPNGQFFRETIEYFGLGLHLYF
ncbi:MAG: DUF1207 domain-containing protein [bacterium]